MTRDEIIELMINNWIEAQQKKAPEDVIPFNEYMNMSEQRCKRWLAGESWDTLEDTVKFDYWTSLAQNYNTYVYNMFNQIYNFARNSLNGFRF